MLKIREIERFISHYLMADKDISYQLALHEEAARIRTVILTAESLLVGIAHHARQQVEIKLARLTRTLHISPHSLQGAHRYSFLHESRYLARKEVEVLGRLDLSPHQLLHFLLQSVQVILLKCTHILNVIILWATKLHYFSDNSFFYRKFFS